MNYSDFDAKQIIAGIAKDDFTSTEVAESLIKQAEKWSNTNALINFDFNQFLRSAREADKKRQEGKPVGPLHGLPLVVKDNIDVVGFATTASTPALKGYTPTKQGPVIEALKNAGAIIMAKTNLHELAFSPAISEAADGSPVRWGAYDSAKNPYNLEYSTAGSSSGTGAAISARIAPVGLGTDTGGSVRNPAAWCGITGLRPSTKRYSQVGVVPLSWTRDTIGPMARHVGDLALLDGVITGEGTIEPAEIRGLKLGIDWKFYCADCDPDVLQIFEKEVGRLSAAGAEIIDVTIEKLEEYISELGPTLTTYEVVRGLPKYLAESGINIEFKDLISQITATGMGRRLEELLTVDATSEDVYRHAISDIRPAIQMSYADVFSKYNIDALIFPSSLLPPNKVCELGTASIRGRDISYLLASSHNVQPASIGGSPGLTVAAGLTKSGLPAAIGFDGPVGSDRNLLAIGLAYDEIKPDLPKPVLT